MASSLLNFMENTSGFSKDVALIQALSKSEITQTAYWKSETMLTLLGKYLRNKDSHKFRIRHRGMYYLFFFRPSIQHIYVLEEESLVNPIGV